LPPAFCLTAPRQLCNPAVKIMITESHKTDGESVLYSSEVNFGRAERWIRVLDTIVDRIILFDDMCQNKFLENVLKSLEIVWAERHVLNMSICHVLIRS
jgi:hypothetical protein